MATYIAITTINARDNGYNRVLAAGKDKQAVRKAAENKITGDDIYAQTERINLVVVSKTEAKRRFGFDWNKWTPEDAPYERYEWLG